MIRNREPNELGTQKLLHLSFNHSVKFCVSLWLRYIYVLIMADTVQLISHVLTAGFHTATLAAGNDGVIGICREKKT